MAVPVLKILFMLIVLISFCGIQVDCRAERYAFSIVENGTSFKEEVEVDVDDQTEIIRVPQHNHVDAVEVMNDFISGLSVRRDPVTRVCYVSKLDFSLPSPGKMKLDMDQASRQSSLPNEVKTRKSAWKVVGFANRTVLPQKILKFCGTFPIYEARAEDIPLDILNASGRQVSGRARTKRDHVNMQWNLCSDYHHKTLEDCLKKVGHYGISYNCITDKIYCYYIAKCRHKGSDIFYFDFECNRINHWANYFGFCCTPSC